MSGIFKGLVKLSQSQWEEMIKYKTITVNGIVYNYDPNILYVAEKIYVTLDTAQDITGNKNFKGDLQKNNIDVATINDIPPVVDSLNQTSSTSSLSANQGKVLNDKINELVSTLQGFSASFTYNNLSEVMTAFDLNVDVSIPSDSYSVGKSTIVYNNQTRNLKNGDSFYIIDTEVPDYWFSLDDMKLYKMETQKVDLSSYARTEQLSNYLPLSGGKMIGSLKWNGAAALPKTTTIEHFLLTDSFASGGTTKWASLQQVKEALEVPTSYVAPTQYATSSTPGLVKTSSNYGLNLNVSDGTISVSSATNEEIEAKTNNYKPIVPANLEKAVATIGDSRYGRIRVENSVIIIE